MEDKLRTSHAQLQSAIISPQRHKNEQLFCIHAYTDSQLCGDIVSGLIL